LWTNAVLLALIVSADRFTFLWLVEDTIGSPTWASGLIVFSLGAPVCLLVLTAGALADRHDRGRMLMLTQAAGTLVVLLGAVLVWIDVITLASAVLLAVAFGTVVAFAMPVRSSLVPALVGTERVMHAVVLMTVGANVAMIVGPLLVGGGLMGGSAFTLLPRIARDEFGRNAAEAARLFALMGLGMVTTSLLLMRYRSRIRRRGLVFMCSMVFGTTVQILQGFAPSFVTLELLLLSWGLTGGLYLNLNQALIQELTPRDRMGRVVALSTMVSAGLLPLGGLTAALVASAVGGTQASLSMFGLLGLTCVLLSLWRARGLRALA